MTETDTTPRAYGLIEAGGTKFVLGLALGTPEALATAPAGTLRARGRIATTTPGETLPACVAWLRGAARDAGVALAGIGIGSFGPLHLDRASPLWGRIAPTPKPHWAGADIVTPFAEAFGCPLALDTDVNAAALAEARWGVGKGTQGSAGALLYLTIGTGIGGGFVDATGALLRGLSHPEMGHIRLPRHPEDHAFAGSCPVHGGACFEGLASGTAIAARWGASLSELPAEHPAHAIIAWYLGEAIATLQAVLEPAHVVLGGGVMATPGLVEAASAAAAKAGAGYFTGDAARIVSTPALWPDSGLLGALALVL